MELHHVVQRVGQRRWAKRPSLMRLLHNCDGDGDEDGEEVG